MAKSDNGIACCGHHLICQHRGQCVNPLLGQEFPRCSLKERVIDYPFPTLYKLKELGLVEDESNKLTAKGIDLIKRYIGEMPEAYLIMLTLFFEEGGDPRRIKPKFFRIKEMLKDDSKV